ncbi:MAG: polymer-forming cytoskeletal protein [Anaerolineae bacterium]|nr:polymer-forming cytoskeletal protein [Anaerolineae bacterium]
MRHLKFMAALAALIITLGVLYVAGQSARAVWQELGRAGEQIGLTDDYALSGDWDGDLVVFASSILLPEDSTISGDAALVSNYVRLDALIMGDLSASASQITLGPAAHINGSASLTGENVTIDGIIEGPLTVQASQVTLGENSQLASGVEICAGTVIDNRAGSAPLAPCQPPTLQPVNPLWAAGGVAAGVLALAVTLAGGVLAAVPHISAPLRMARVDAGLRLRPTPRLLSGIVALGLWGVLAVLLAALPGGWLSQTLFIIYLGLSLLFGLPLVWLGVSLAGLWIGRLLLHIFRKPNAAAPWAALTGGLLISLFLVLVGLTSTFGLAGLALLAALGLAAMMAGRAAGAVGDGARQTSYFVQG